MKKKIILSLIAVVAVVGGVAALSAYEAHVINVTAHIENALSVTPEEIMFGTVFPQEYLTKPLTIAMSDSFFTEDRVDDIEYIIAQKPKPRSPEDWEYCLESWEEALDNFMWCWFDCEEGGGSEKYCWHQCKDILFDYAEPETCYPPLCPWLSKMPDGTPPNDEGVYPFEGMFDVAYGRLAKSEGDIEDTWIIDLIVSCFQGMCAQDYSWEQFGPPIPPEFEGETFGCDLWIEVTGISRINNPGEPTPYCGDGNLDGGEDCEVGYEYCTAGYICNLQTCLCEPEPGPEEILGCTDPEALNYDPEATINDESCTYPEPISTSTNLESPSATGGHNSDWDSPTNAYFSNDQYASRQGSDVTPYYQSYETFGFGIPSGVTIDGIEVSFEGDATGNNWLCIELYNNSSSTWTPHDVSKCAIFTTSESTYTVGGAADLWGKSWLASDFSDANFSVRLKSNTSLAVTYVDHIQVKVYYTQ